jgi:hypothetical protein
MTIIIVIFINTKMSTNSYHESNEMKAIKNGFNHGKYTSKDWESFEMKVLPFEKEVIEMLKKLSDTVSWKSLPDRVLPSCVSFYKEKRLDKELCKLLGLKIITKPSEIKEDKKKSSKKKGLTVEEIRQENSKRKFCREVSQAEVGWDADNWSSIPELIGNKTIERIIMDLIFHINGMTTFKHKIIELELYECVMGISKILEKLVTFEIKDMITGKIQMIDKILIDDLNIKFDELKLAIKFDMLTCATKYPKLLILTKYDNILPGLAMCPYQSQIDIVKLIHENFSNGCLLALQSLTGEGKTSLIISIANLVMKMRGKKNINVLYCCSEKLETVRKQVGQYSYNGVIPFGVADFNKSNGNVKITDNYNCKQGTPRVLVISDIICAIELLKDTTKEWVLVFDEPTVFLDRTKSFMIDYLAKIFSNLPKITILASATMPERESISLLEELFIRKYPSANVSFIKSEKVRIASEVSDYIGNIYVPHVNCETISDLRLVLSKIKSNMFLQKNYTVSVVNQMNIAIQKFNLPIPDFKSYISLIGNLTQQAFQNFAIICLESIIATNNDVIVKEFCSVSYKKSEGINFHSLAEEAHKLENQTLILTTNPNQLFEEYFSAYITKVHKILGNTKERFDTIYQVYKKQISEFNKKLEKIAEDVKNEDEYYFRKKQLEEDKPLFPIEANHILGSFEYCAKRKSNHSRIIPNLDDVDFNDIYCTDDQKMGLVLGIGLYSPSTMDRNYTNLVIEWASQGLLAFIIADDDICYGTNYPIENVIVDNSPAVITHSVNTIFQVFSRAGRPGKSWKANIYAHTEILSKIDSFVKNNTFKDIETDNFNIALIKSSLIQVIETKKCKIEKIQIDEKLEKKRLEQERLKERLEKERLEQERLEKERLEQERIKSQKYVPPSLRNKQEVQEGVSRWGQAKQGYTSYSKQGERDFTNWRN